MLRIFFCASAAGGATSPTTPSTETSTTNTNKQSLIGRAMDFSSFAERTRGARDGRPGDTREEFEGHRAERDSSTVTSVESVQDGSWNVGHARGGADPASRMAATIYEALAGYKRSALPPGRSKGSRCEAAHEGGMRTAPWVRIAYSLRHHSTV